MMLALSSRQRAVRLTALLTLPLLANACAGAGERSSPALPAASASRAKAIRARPAEVGGSAASFVDSVGVNVHFGDANTPYGENPARIATLIAKLGVHHLRDGTFPGQSNLCSLDRAYAAQGVTFDFIVSPNETDAQLASWQACSSPAADAYEGYNEYDLSGDPNWVADLQAAQQQIYDYAHGIDLIAAGPALTSESAYGEVGPVPADVGNMHDYFAGRNPGTPGWGESDGFGTYGSMAYDIAIAQQTTGSAPMWATETGYGDQPGTQSYVPAVTKMHYTLRTLLLHWNAGVARTYVYELIDEGGGSFGSYGLTNAKTVPKPAFNAVAALLAHLAGGGTGTASLDYTLDAGSSIDHALFALNSNHFVLALWQEVPEWDPNTNQPITVYPQPVSLIFPSAPQQIDATTFRSNGKPLTQPLVAQTTVNLNVDGGVTLVDIYP
jgi:hypothetical protein